MEDVFEHLCRRCDYPDPAAKRPDGQGRCIDILEGQEFDQSCMLRQIRLCTAEQAREERTCFDDAGGKGRAPPWQAAEIARLHHECLLPCTFKSGDNGLAEPVLVGAIYRVQGNAVPEQDGMGRLGPVKLMDGIVPGAPAVDQRPCQRRPHTQQQVALSGLRVAEHCPVHVHIKAEARERPERYIVEPPAFDWKSTLDLLNQ